MTGKPTKLEFPTGPFFIVGTEWEATRLIENGFEAIDASEHDLDNVVIEALYGASGRTCAGTAILLLDDYEASLWSDALDKLSIPHMTGNLSSYVRVVSTWHEEFYSDEEAAERYLFRLEDVLQPSINEALQNMEADRVMAVERGLLKRHVHDTMGVAMEIYGGDVHSERIPTGLKSLDKAIGGGMPQGGLTVLGAGSSNGKTTLAVQVADSLAAAGWPVLFVTIEQSRHELVAKSLSRMMRQTPKQKGGYYVASAAHIMDKAERRSWSADKTQALLKCCTDYTQTVAPHMHIMEMSGQPTFEDIQEAYVAVSRVDCGSCRDEDGIPIERRPVLVLDYLQLVRAKNDKMTDRQAVDYNVMAMRQLARDNQTAVLVISSINRQSYSEGAGMSAFKESGAIEFSADLALMLQPRGFSEKVRGVKSDKAAKDAAQEAMEQHKGKANRQSEVVVLKNRGGAMPSKPVPLDYDAMCNLFTDAEDGSKQEDARRIR